MQVIARSTSVRISPRKVRIVADAIRDMSIDQALQSLKVIEKRGAYALTKTLNSAVANAVNNAKLDRATLKITKVEVTEGTALNRYHPSTRGRIHPYKKRSSHITITVTGGEAHGTKS